MKDAESCKGLSAFNDLADSYGHHLPGNPADLFDWLLEQPQDMVLMLLAFGVGRCRGNGSLWQPAHTWTIMSDEQPRSSQRAIPLEPKRGDNVGSQLALDV
ncbi:hypothetical protein [Ensifer aridi]|uniref:hypothetical protein n=1 Tax=Ensifer aridi TaxID=1708715 RepID=UPI00040C87B9|nr:hypothetical protein [Ensifer aridi]